jgi:DNA replication licensing factor MCM5
MSLATTVTEEHVQEAHRLFKVSTLSAASNELKSSRDIPTEMVPITLRVEETIRRRLAIGAKISYSKLTEELALRYTSTKAIEFVN